MTQNTPTESIEDYLERIYDLIQEKGYARAVDIAQRLSIKQSSVTKMIKNLDEKGYLVYERYRGLKLTSKGEKIAQSIKERHRILAKLLQYLGLNQDQLQSDIEGIEHHISPVTFNALKKLVKYFENHPEATAEIKNMDSKELTSQNKITATR